MNDLFPRVRLCKPGHCNSGVGFTLIELLIVIAIIALLSAVLLPVLTRSRMSAQSAVCQSNMRELGLAAQMYWSDNANKCFLYDLPLTNVNNVAWEIWWFGWLQHNGAEGRRAFDLSSGYLFPYVNRSNARLCPSPVWNLPWFQLKGTNFIFSYGYNRYMGLNPLATVGQIRQPSQIALFADSAVTDTYQGRGTPANPVFEESYYLSDETSYIGAPNNYFPNGHFRHSQKANVVFCDGHVGMETMMPGSLDAKLPGLDIGQLSTSILKP